MTKPKTPSTYPPQPEGLHLPDGEDCQIRPPYLSPVPLSRRLTPSELDSLKRESKEAMEHGINFFSSLKKTK